MSWTSIVLSLAGFVCFNYVMYSIITRKELKLLKFWFFFMFFLSGTSMGLLPYIIGNNAADESSFNLVSIVYVLIVVFGTLIFVYNWIIKVFLQAFKDVDDKAKAVKNPKEESLI